MPKLALAVNEPSYAQSSHSSGGMARVSLDKEDAWKDDFKTPHIPVHHVVWHDRGGSGELATERMEPAEGSPSWQSYYEVNVDEEVEMLKSINPHWRATCWLQKAVQGIAEEEVPWYKLVTQEQKALLCHCQVPTCGLEVEYGGVWGRCLPNHPNCPQHQTVHDQGRNVRGHRRATMVYGLLLCPAVSR